MDSGLKQVVLEQLEKLANDRKAKNETFRYRAYKKAIQAIKEYESEIKSIDDLDKINGLAKGSIRAKIEELIKTGKIEEVNTISKESKIIDILSNIYGIGPSKANDLVNTHNIISIEDLKQKVKENEKILNSKQKIGLTYYDDLLKRIPRLEMSKHDKFITDFIKSIDKKNELIYEIVGSYRREASNSGDIDILCTAPYISSGNPVHGVGIFNNIIKNMKNNKYIVETLAKGEKKFMGICKLPRHKTNRRLDIIYTNYENYAFTLLYFTGSAQFNVEMRNHALSLGYSMNEYGLFEPDPKERYGLTKNNKTVNYKFETEQDIFKFLGIKYVEPKYRKAGKVQRT